MIISMDILKAIILICSTTSVEDSSSSWSEFRKVQKEQKHCREYYYECMNGNNIPSKLVKCDKEREL